MKNATSPARRLLLSKNFILMIVMLVLIIVAISAWFSFHKTVDANNIAVKAVSTEIDIAPCIKTYSDNYTSVASDGPGEFTHEINIPAVSLSKDCTGDGLNLIVPEFNVTKDYDSVRTHYGKEVNVNVGAANAVSNLQSELALKQNPDAEPPEYQFYEFEFYARSKNPELFLQNDSQLLAKTEKDGHSLSDVLEANNSKRSAYSSGILSVQPGDPVPVNVDGIVGAMRMSLVGEACSSVTQTWKAGSGNEAVIDTTDSVRLAAQKQLLWLPRPDVKLNIPNDAGDVTNWTLSTGLTSGDTFNNTYYKTINGNSSVELVNDNDSKTIISSGRDTNSRPNLGTNIKITDFSNNGEPIQRNLFELVVDNKDTTVKDYYYVTKYTLRIWIEGTDSEARRAMDGGEFQLTLNLF